MTRMIAINDDTVSVTILIFCRELVLVSDQLAFCCC